MEAEEWESLEKVTNLNRAFRKVQREEVGRMGLAVEDMGGGVGRHAAGWTAVGRGPSSGCHVAVKGG